MSGIIDPSNDNLWKELETLWSANFRLGMTLMEVALKKRGRVINKRSIRTYSLKST